MKRLIFMRKISFGVNLKVRITTFHKLQELGNS